MPYKKKSKEKAEPDVDYGKIILDEKNYYEQATQTQRLEWEELWKLYIGELPATKNKSLSKNFIPKVHNAVETSASFLAANQPTITAIPVGDEDDDKAAFMSHLLQFQWEYTLKMKPKILSMTKSSSLFGVGIMKVGWDMDGDEPFAYPLNLGNFYTDPTIRFIQEAPSVVERIVIPLERAKNQYGEAAQNLQPMKAKTFSQNDSSIFDSHDLPNQPTVGVKFVEILERWTLDKVCTVAVQQKVVKNKKSVVGVVLREQPNPYGFIPYVSFHFKDSPLPNRFYTIGLIEPVKRVQKRMNQLVNQIVDNANLILSPAAKVRRGSGINPRDLGNLFPGKTIPMSDVQRDLEFITVPDTTATGFNLFAALNAEFQQGTAITDLRQGQGSPDTATAARIQQSNLNTQTALIKQNLEYAIAEIGQMLCKLNIKYIDSVRSIRIFDPQDIARLDTLMGNQNQSITPLERSDIRQNGRVLQIDKNQLDGDFDIRVRADSTLVQNREVLRKQLIDYAQFMNSIGVQIDVQELSERFGELMGIPNVHKLISRESPPPPPSPEPDPVKVLQALADLVTAGEPVSFEQLQVALEKAGLPPNRVGGQPSIEPDFVPEEPAQRQVSTGPGGGQSLTPTSTSEGLTSRSIEAETQVSPQGPLTK